MTSNAVMTRTSDGDLLWECPGCGAAHGLRILGDGVLGVRESGSARWRWNGDMARPTISPSLRHTWTLTVGTDFRCCHYFIRDGQIEFCADSTHELAGKTVPMPTWSDAS